MEQEAHVELCRKIVEIICNSDDFDSAMLKILNGEKENGIIQTKRALEAVYVGYLPFEKKSNETMKICRFSLRAFRAFKIPTI